MTEHAPVRAGYVRNRRLLCMMLMLAALAVPVVGPAMATEVDAPGVVVDSRLGGIGAIGCGAGIRALQMTGPNLGVIVATVALCFLMIVDGAGS